ILGYGRIREPNFSNFAAGPPVFMASDFTTPPVTAANRKRASTLIAFPRLRQAANGAPRRDLPTLSILLRLDTDKNGVSGRASANRFVGAVGKIVRLHCQSEPVGRAEICRELG